MALRVVIADDDPVIRDALRDVLDAEPDIDVVAVAEDAAEVVALVERHAPSIAVLDVRMPGGGGVRAARELRRRAPRTRLMAFTAYADDSLRTTMLEAGVLAYVVKGVPNAEIVATVRELGAHRM